MADLTDIQSALTVKLTGSNSSGVEDNYADIDTSGRLTVKLNDGAGSAINLGQSTMANSVPVAIASNQSAIPVTQSGSWTSSISNFPTTVDTNYGTVGASTLRTASQIGNATGAAAFGAGVTGAQVLRVVLPTDQTAIPVSQSGTWTVQQGTPPWTIQGDSASGASKAGNPVQVGGVFNTTQPTVTTGQTVEAQSTARGALIVATGVDSFNVNNVSGTVSLPTGAATAANQATEITSLQLLDNIVGSGPGAGTAGTGSALVGGVFNTALPTLTNGQQAGIQLDSSARLLIGSIASALPAGPNTIGAVNQGTANTLANAWSTKLTDGTNGPVAVKAASTAPVATDPSLVVTISPNSASLIISPLPATGSKFSFGGVTTASTSQVPVNATAYTEVTTNAAMTLVSSSALDTSAGTGARTVAITYYDNNMTGPQVVTITLNGTTAVTSPNNNMAYVEKMVVATVGSGGGNAGTLTLKSGATTVGTIAVGNNETAWAHHYVPQGKTCYISGFSVGTTGTAAGQGGTFVLKTSTPTVANTPETQVSDFVISPGAVASVARIYNSPIQVVGPARVRAYVTPAATSSYTNYAAFDYIDN
jgi:hypothetical protein